MSWVKLDDQFPTHPKVLRAGPDAAWLHVCALCYCATYLTDGLVPKEAVATLSTLRSPGRLAARLVEVGLWYDRGDRYEVHDFLEYNPTRDHVESVRAASRERARKNGKTSGVVRAKRTRDSREKTNPDPYPLQPPTEVGARTRRGQMFVALIMACGIEADRLTKSERSDVNRTAKELDDAGVDPDALARFPAWWARTFSGAKLTHRCFREHWAKFSSNGHADEGIREVDGHRERFMPGTGWVNVS